MSKGGRRRVVGTAFRITGAVVTIGGLVVGIVMFTGVFQGDPKKMSTAVHAAPVKTITLRTDGVLDQKWVAETLKLSPNVTLMEVDIHELSRRLAAYPQVVTASVARKFPSTLEVTLGERSPVALVNAQVGNAAPRPLMVARDGVVFPGTGYDSATWKSLPFLDGLKLQREGEGFRPIEGMRIVADLLATARNEAPHLYHTWRVVSLARLEREGELDVRATNVDRIVFTTRSDDDFLRQIAQLDVLIDSVQAQTDTPVQEINLAVGRMTDGRIQVPVTFRESPQVMPPPQALLKNQLFKPTRPPHREL